MRPCRVLVAIVLLLTCCGKAESPTRPIPAPPGPGGGSMGGDGPGPAQGGSPEGGGGETDASAGAGTGEPTGMPCQTSSACLARNSFCMAGECRCAFDRPDLCGEGASAVCVSQQLAPEHCGECGHACPGDAACSGGRCSEAPADVATIAGCGGNVQLASFGSSLFFTDAANGKVVALPLVGGAAVDLAVEQLHPTQIAADESGVYWLNRGDGSAGSSRVMKRGFPLDSSSPIALKTAPTTEVIAALALHGGKLYYALGSDVHEIATDENQTDDVVVGVAFYMSAGIPVANGHVAGLAVNAQRVVWATDDSENVDSHPLAPVGDLASSTDLARLGRITGSSGVGKQVAVDESYAYWVTQSIFSRSSVDGSEPHQQAIFSQFEDPMVTFVLSSQRVYGATQGGMIFEHSRTPPVDPTELEEPAAWLARNQMAVRSMVVASDKVYWITGDCEIRSATM